MTPRASRRYDILLPARQTAPLVLASPHSGADYPPEFVAGSPLTARDLRRSEDAFVDELFAAAPEFGAPLLRARFPRAYIDPNRAPFELDPGMFEDPLPGYADVGSRRAAAGHGTIARIVASGSEIYGRKLRFAEAEARVDSCYQPYHAALRRLVGRTRRRFGHCVLLDCHSMPSIGGPMDPDSGRRRADFILGDGFGTTCDDAVTAAVEDTLARQGGAVVRNEPFSGGYTTRHYGRPAEGVHALQIEINRALYMDERTITRLPAFPELARRMAGVVAVLAEIGRLDLAAE